MMFSFFDLSADVIVMVDFVVCDVGGGEPVGASFHPSFQFPSWNGSYKMKMK
jgi:hypothetical protein